MIVTILYILTVIVFVKVHVWENTWNCRYEISGIVHLHYEDITSHLNEPYPVFLLMWNGSPFPDPSYPASLLIYSRTFISL